MQAISAVASYTLLYIVIYSLIKYFKMKALIQKVRDYFEVRKLNRHLKELNKRQASIHWSMQFDDLSKEEIEKNNRRLDAIEIDRRMTQGILYSYDV
jgi:hypothetical protein